MHISTGCSHYLALKGDLPHLETVIAHEMTHGCLCHLPLPLWLNEGLAVNTEQRLAGVPRPEYGAAERLHDRLRRFWSVVSIQEFWSGVSFQRPGESNTVSYDLARILVDQLSRDWEPFREFVVHADRADAGAAAAHQHLGLDLGDAVTALLERDTPKSWSPDPSKWEKHEPVRPQGQGRARHRRQRRHRARHGAGSGGGRRQGRHRRPRHGKERRSLERA